jgi:dTDP-4-dehydrorhamnose reductase
MDKAPAIIGGIVNERSRRTILVIGSRGMLGMDLVEVLRGDDAVRSAEADIDDVDITNAESVAACLERERPDVVINCAAYTDVDGCESNEQAAGAANATGPGLLARACERRGARLLHISTDYVFDGSKKSPYLPDDPPRPLSAYGRTKLAGERAVAAACQNHLIVRTAWLYGAHGRNFVATMLRLGREKPALRVVNDQYGSPTWTADLAPALAKLAASTATGITHATNAGSCSWYEFACEIMRLAGIDTPVHAIPTAEFPRPATRPANSRLDCSRTEEITGIRMRHWRDALAAYLSA